MSGATAVSIGTAVAGAAATAVVSSLLAQKPDTPKVPGATPIANREETELAARRRSIAEQKLRQGRASTILSGDGGSDTLG